MKGARKAKVSVTLDRQLLAEIDRRVGADTTRSEIIEEWLRLAMLGQARRDLEAATVAYYEGRTPEQHAEDESLSAFSARAAQERDLDRSPAARRRRR